MKMKMKKEKTEKGKSKKEKEKKKKKKRNKYIYKFSKLPIDRPWRLLTGIKQTLLLANTEQLTSPIRNTGSRLNIPNPPVFAPEVYCTCEDARKVTTVYYII